jgi:hypothetical protein
MRRLAELQAPLKVLADSDPPRRRFKRRTKAVKSFLPDYVWYIDYRQPYWAAYPRDRVRSGAKLRGLIKCGE